MSEQYIKIACKFWGLSPEELTPYVYRLTKRLILGRAYGMGWKKAKEL